MHNELQEGLYAKFPTMFRSMRESKWGIECGSGWCALLHMLCEEISSISHYKDVQFAQIKEKFSALCVYFQSDTCHGSVAVSHNVIAAYEKLPMYEKLSMHVCETCGAYMQNRCIPKHKVDIAAKGWVKTLCDTCYHDSGFVSNKHLSGHELARQILELKPILESVKKHGDTTA